MKASAVLRRLRVSERGAVSVFGLIVLALLGGLAYVVTGALATDSDRYGRVAVPSNNWVTLPGTGARIGPLGDPDRALPSDLRVEVLDPRSGEALRLSPRGDSGGVGDDREIAVVDPPSAGVYQMVVSTRQRPAQGARHPDLGLGQTPLGAVVDRFSQIGPFLIGPAGLIIAALLLLLVLVPAAQRALARGARSYG